jgi:hypothetical protein
MPAAGVAQAAFAPTLLAGEQTLDLPSLASVRFSKRSAPSHGMLHTPISGRPACCAVMDLLRLAPAFQTAGARERSNLAAAPWRTEVEDACADLAR